MQNKTKTSSSTSKQKHIFRFDKNPIDSSCFQVPDSGFKFQDLAIARISLVHSTATYKDRGKVRYLQCFLLRYGSLSTLQNAPGELQKLLGWILGGGATIYIYVCVCVCLYVCGIYIYTSRDVLIHTSTYACTYTHAFKYKSEYTYTKKTWLPDYWLESRTCGFLYHTWTTQ